METLKATLGIIVVLILMGLFMNLMDEPAYAGTRNATATVNSTGEAIETLSTVGEENVEVVEESHTEHTHYTSEEDEVVCTYDICPVCGDEMINEGECCCGRDDWDYCPVCQHYNENVEVIEKKENEDVHSIPESEADDEICEEVESTDGDYELENTL